MCYCFCDDCMSGNTDDCFRKFPRYEPEEMEELLKQMEELFPGTPKCPGFKTELHYHECGAEVNSPGDICWGCEVLREEAEAMINEACDGDKEVEELEVNLCDTWGENLHRACFFYHESEEGREYTHIHSEWDVLSNPILEELTIKIPTQLIQTHPRDYATHEGYIRLRGITYRVVIHERK